MVGHYVVNGDFVAFTDRYLSHYGDGAISVEVVRLRGPEGSRSRLVGRLDPVSPQVKVTDLVVSRRGRPAYIVLRTNVDYPFPPDSFDYDLPLSEVRDARGRVLDSGPVSDLRARRGLVTWLHGDRRRNAEFG